MTTTRTLPQVGDTITVEILNRLDPRWGEKIDVTVTAVASSAVRKDITEIWWTSTEVDYLGNVYYGARGVRA